MTELLGKLSNNEFSLKFYQAYVSLKANIKNSTFQLIIHFLVCAVILVLAMTAISLARQIFIGMTPKGVEANIVSRCLDANGQILDCKTDIMPLGRGRYRIAVDDFQGKELKLLFNILPQDAQLPSILMLRKGYNILGGPSVAKLKVMISKEERGFDNNLQSINIEGASNSFTQRSFITLPKLSSSDSLVVTIHNADNQNEPIKQKLVIDEIGLYQNLSGFLDEDSGFVHNLYSKHHQYWVNFLRGAVVLLLVFLACTNRRKAIVLGGVYIILFGIVVNLTLLSSLFNPETQRDLRVVFASGTLRDFAGANLNYGLHMASNILQGNGPLIKNMPPWHRMPGYGFLIALAGNASNLLSMAMNAIFLQVLVNVGALVFFFWSALRIMPIIVAGFVTSMIACLPSQMYYLQIESIMPGIVLFCAATACLYIAYYRQNKNVPFLIHILFHCGFALWFFFRTDVLPGWALVSLCLYGKHWRSWKYFLIPITLFFMIGFSWGTFKRPFTGEFSMATNSFGASAMVGLWEVPNKFIWEISDSSYLQWINKIGSEKIKGWNEGGSHSTSQIGSNLAMKEVFRFWVTYPGYIISLVWHKFILYTQSLAWHGHHLHIVFWSRVSIMFLLTIMGLSLAINYKRLETLLLGWTIPFNMTMFLLIYSSEGRFYNASTLGLLVATLPLLLDINFYRKLFSRAIVSSIVIFLGLLIGINGSFIDSQLLDWSKFRYGTPILDSKDSSLSVFKPAESLKGSEDPQVENKPNLYSFNLATFDLAYKKAKLKKVLSNEGETKVVITTAPQRFAYAAKIPIPEEVKKNDHALLSIDLIIRSGSAVIGVLTQDEQRFLENSSVFGIPWWQFSEEKKHITLSVKSFQEAGFIVVSSGDGARRGVIEIQSISIKKE